MDIVEPQWSETGSLIKTTAMDIVEPQRPESGSPIKTTAMDIVEPQRPESTDFGLRPDLWGDWARAFLLGFDAFCSANIVRGRSPAQLSHRMQSKHPCAWKKEQ